jgi:hypothetical protein
VNWLDLLDAFNLIDRIEGLMRGLWYGGGTRTLKVEHDEKVLGKDYEDALRKRGVAVFGRGATSTELRWKIKQRQARWAEYNLRRMNAPVTSKDVDPANRKAIRYAGALPPAWSDRRKRR